MTSPRPELHRSEPRRTLVNRAQCSRLQSRVPATPIRSRLLAEPFLHASLNLILLNDFAFECFPASALNSFTNVDRVLNVFETSVVWKGVKESPDFFFRGGHLSCLLFSIREARRSSFGVDPSSVMV